MMRSQLTPQLMNASFTGAAVLLAFSPAAAALKYGFPAMALAYAASLLWWRRPAQYVSLCLWLFLFTPLIRRIIDQQVGWDPVAITLLAPYAAIGLSVFWLPRYFGRFRPLDSTTVGFLMIFLSASFGLFVAFAEGRYLPGAFDYIRWVLPAAFGIHLWAEREHHEEIAASVAHTLALAVIVIGLYAGAQYIDIARWDAYWMINSEMTSIGQPEPFGVRVFSTLNSPGSLGSAMVFSVLVLAASPSSLRWIALPLGVLALGLSLSRTSWAALFAGLVVVLAFGSHRSRLTIAGLAATLVLLAPSLLVFPEILTGIERRFETVLQLSDDVSISERLEQYEAWMRSMLDLPFGTGLGATGVYQQSLSRGASVNIIDSGYIETFQALGVGFGAVYLLGLLTVAAALLWKRPISKYREVATVCKAVIVGQLVAFWSTSTTIGEAGFFFFLAAGLLAATPDRAAAASPADEALPSPPAQTRSPYPGPPAPLAVIR